MFVAVYTVLMLIYPNDQHYQFAGFPLFYSLNFNITLSLQFPPAATGPDLSRSYQHNSLMTLKPFRWRKHQHSHVHTWTPSIYPLSIRTPTHIFYKNTYRHTYLVSVIETLSLSFFFFSHSTIWDYTSLTQEKGNQFYAGNYLHTIFWQKL